MEISNNVRNLIYGMFDNIIEGADKYVTKSSTWLIFTEEKRWVFEFTNEKTLWYNYNIFQSELNLLSIDCVESKDIIKEWFESRFLEEKITHVTDTSNVPYSIVENTIQNGVKYVKDVLESLNPDFEDTIKNGVKEVEKGSWFNVLCAEDAIQNGVKDTKHLTDVPPILVKNVIQNGVKDTLDIYSRCEWEVKHAIKNGVRHVEDGDWLDNDERIDDIIQNGVKGVRAWGFNMRQSHVEDTIQNGVKEIKHKTAESYQQKDHMVTNSIITEDINYAIEYGVKE